ncbi:FHA domain-containing protein [Agreia sp. Leaf283]|uniref:FHA domain-containing protein FhaB/FipA n=1 Tax=Agreia sp. Leaf283 TaxID=1736321 RepID=UPI0006F2628E|nr:FHA domain-containing protein [Agreia sp. Leaf283]KQP53766.1 hypothetical protein ASF51_16540 [Agreia sp. Leaf283]
MSELTLLILQFAFLALLWIFVFVVVYAMRSDLFGRRVKKLPDAQAASAGGFPGAAPAPAAAVSTNTPPRQQAPVPQSKVPTFTPLEGSSAGTHPRATTGNAARLVITTGTKSGTEIPLGTMPLTIGRSTDSSVVIRDDYTSTHHARLMVWNEEWMLQDLDSTNGTFLDGKRVTSPVNVPLNTPIKIGATSFELRR